MMKATLLSLLPFVAPALGAPLAAPPSSELVHKGDAPYSVDSESLKAAITCPQPPTHRSKTVLLVHGTGSTGYESWGSGYVPALQSDGYTPCYVDLPNRAMDDMQVSSEYIAYAMHHLSAASGGRKIHVVSHSQGGPDTQWALRFWPSTRNVVKSWVALSPDLAGVDQSSLLYKLCTFTLTNSLKVYLCSPGLWQQAIGSNYYKALNYRKTTFVPTTTIYSVKDTTVPPPAANALLPGGAVAVAVQFLCSKRDTSHIGMLTDPTAYHLATNAFANPAGTADVDHADRTMPKGTCEAAAAPGMDTNLVSALGTDLGDIALGILLGGTKTAGEPPLKPYARIENQ